MTMLKMIKQVDLEADKKSVCVAECNDHGEIVHAVMVAPYIHKKSSGFVFWQEIKRHQDLDTAMRNMIHDYKMWQIEQDVWQARLRFMDEEKAKREREIKFAVTGAMAELGLDPCGAGTITSRMDKDYVFEGSTK